MYWVRYVHFLPWNEIYKLPLGFASCPKRVFLDWLTPAKEWGKPFGLADASEGKGLEIDGRYLVGGVRRYPC